MRDVCWSKTWADRSFTGKGKRERHRESWIHRATNLAWQRTRLPGTIVYTAMGPPLRSPRHPFPHPEFPGLLPQPPPFQPFFHTNPFEALQPPTSALIPLRVLAQFRPYWLYQIVRPPTRPTRLRQRGSDPLSQTHRRMAR